MAPKDSFIRVLYGRKPDNNRCLKCNTVVACGKKKGGNSTNLVTHSRKCQPEETRQLLKKEKQRQAEEPQKTKKDQIKARNMSGTGNNTVKLFDIQTKITDCQPWKLDDPRSINIHLSIAEYIAGSNASLT